MLLVCRLTAVFCLAVTLLGSVLLAAPPGYAAPAGWQHIAYKGAGVPGGAGRPATRIPSYSLAYPPRWMEEQWPDSLAGYGQLNLWSPAGGTVDLVLLPLRPHGPTLAGMIAHDASFLATASRDSIVLPLGKAASLGGPSKSAGLASRFLYLQRNGIVYRFFTTGSLGSTVSDVLVQIAKSLHVPAAPAGHAAPPPPVAPRQSACCHCPAWGAGWGNVLTRLDGIPVYWNAGNIDNGCNGTYGITYQCVELVQRYFALRWGYPAIWRGVEAASDMRTHHPAGIEFIPNGGSPGPQEGDALLFYGGLFGHVAMIESVDRHTGQIDVVEENWSPTGQANLTIYADNTIAIRDSSTGSYTIAGWLHSTKNKEQRS